MHRICLLFTAIFSTLIATAQTDTSFNNLNEVVVTATRTERKLGNIAVPVSIISQKNIQQAASLRLNDILNEQAGLYLTAGFGTGVQMQGLNPDYTLILLNGEPLIGRTAGVLDLNRIAVGNVQKIEIVKGPSSSLYGSEAMAGVINIITNNAVKNNYNAALRYGTYNTLDANVLVATTINKLGLQAFVNSYSTDGYSIRPNSVERTVAPLWRLTNQLQLNYKFSNTTKLSILTRYSYGTLTIKLLLPTPAPLLTAMAKKYTTTLTSTPYLHTSLAKNLVLHYACITLILNQHKIWYRLQQPTITISFHKIFIVPKTKPMLPLTTK